MSDVKTFNGDQKSLGQANKEHEELNTILETVGKTL